MKVSESEMYVWKSWEFRSADYVIYSDLDLNGNYTIKFKIYLNQKYTR